MSTSSVIYKGNLRTESTHLESGTVILTDAPKDNNGKGEAFSPTDLMSTSLANCMLTIMGILAKREGWNMDETKAEVTKVMYSDPRRVGEIHIKITFPNNNFDEKQRKMLENAAHTCPVAKSLHPDIKQEIEFIF